MVAKTDNTHGHKGFIGGKLYCPQLGSRVDSHGTYAGFIICPHCGKRLEGLVWK